MKVAVPKETYPGERRVALIPANVPHLAKAGLEVVVETGAGQEAGFADEQYTQKGAAVMQRDDLFAADIVLQVRALGANLEAGRNDLGRLRDGQLVIGMCDPLGEPGAARDIAGTGALLFALELTPRITRAQSMDVLSSMATIAGYRAVLLAAVELPKMFPMLMTAAGTLKAARVFVIGAGVAGLQAIATARRLGGVVHAYDVRPACREQVASLGGKFVELQLPAEQSEDKGGYAKAMGEEFYIKQRELMAEVVAKSDVVVTTAAIPGKPSPLLITAAAVAGMDAGSVIVDLAAERGGNCELSQPEQRVVQHGVVILGPTNLPSETPNHASQMFSNNVTKFLLNMIKDGQVELNLEDEIIRDTLLTRDGEVRHWFAYPIGIQQTVSWLLLAQSIILVVWGVVLLRRVGKSVAPSDQSPVFEWENTEMLVTTGIYRYIRHPMYSSLLFLAWGALLKSVTEITLTLAGVATLALIVTAKMEETENLDRFGDEYRDYMRRTRLFVPFLL